MASFKQAEHLFNRDESDRIVGAIRNNNFAVHEIPCVVEKLDHARSTGSLTTAGFRALYQFISLLKKYPRSGNDQLCKDTAYAKLISGERDCGDVNSTILSRINSDRDLFDRVKTIIEDIVGVNVPTNFFQKDIFFGPGSTVNCNNRSFEETSTFFKITDKLVVPDKAKMYLAALISHNSNWLDMLGAHYHTQQNADESRLSFEMRVLSKHLIIVDDDHPSRISFVPKDSSEHRTIGVEMNGLVPLQKLVGDHFRQALKGRGINLDSQERNRHMARLAKTFRLATIDLANASSSISLELVRSLLPPQWFALISDFRSECGQCNSMTPPVPKVRYEMVSSMGNGFTFELESLIFYALAVATAERENLDKVAIKRGITVFGDDIIIPSEIAGTFVNNLKLFGFTANSKKSFLNGHFFESCGADYYNGTDVRPFFLKRKVSTLKDLLFLMNSVMFVSLKHKNTGLIDLYTYLFSRVPAGYNQMGPLHFRRSFESKWDIKTDDLEACLRVPLEFAQANGGVRYSYTLHAWTYKKFIQVAVSHPLEKNPQYAVKHARFMTFLKGQRDGKVLLRGRTRLRVTTDVSSQWDGTLSSVQLAIATHLVSRCGC